MLIIFTIYLLLIISLTIAVFTAKKSRHKTFLLITTVIVITPLACILLLGAFKSQIQQGKFFPKLGTLLLLIAPPDDIWTPLGASILEPNKQEYSFEIIHKYVGNHNVLISFKKLKSMEKAADNNFAVSFTIEKDGKSILSKSSKQNSYYWGKTTSGIIFIRYKVPDEVPINSHLKATVLIDGNIKRFLDKYGETKLVIKKGSDL